MSETKLYKFVTQNIHPAGTCCGLDLDHDAAMKQICCDFLAWFLDNGYKQIDMKPKSTPEFRLYKTELKEDGDTIRMTVLDFDALFKTYNESI